jgi:hypothetical protein
MGKGVGHCGCRKRSECDSGYWKDKVVVTSFFYLAKMTLSPVTVLNDVFTVNMSITEAPKARTYSGYFDLNDSKMVSSFFFHTNFANPIQIIVVRVRDVLVPTATHSENTIVLDVGKLTYDYCIFIVRIPVESSEGNKVRNNLDSYDLK